MFNYYFLFCLSAFQSDTNMNLFSLIFSFSAPTGAQSKAPVATSRRSYSQDSVTQVATAVEKARTAKNSKANAGAKKGSAHADVIDSLDPSSYGGPSKSITFNTAPVLLSLLTPPPTPLPQCSTTTVPSTHALPPETNIRIRRLCLLGQLRRKNANPTSAANFREQRRLAAVDNNFASSNADSTLRSSSSVRVRYGTIPPPKTR